MTAKPAWTIRSVRRTFGCSSDLQGILVVRMPDDLVARQAPAGREAPPRNTTALLGRAYLTLGRRIVDAVVAAGFRQRPAHSAVMAHIDLHGGTRLSTLAARANITPQAVGELVDDLERLGYVVRQPDPADRRAKRVVLTEQGHECVSVAIATIESIEEGLARQLGPERLACLHDALDQIVREQE